jgi:hypothetical protein
MSEVRYYGLDSEQLPRIATKSSHTAKWPRDALECPLLLALEVLASEPKSPNDAPAEDAAAVCVIVSTVTNPTAAIAAITSNIPIASFFITIRQ